jgi:hypothetical protein
MFAFIEPDEFEIVVGFTALVLDPVQRASFTMMARQPNILIEALGETDSFSEPQELPGLDDVGDVSAGATVVMTPDSETRLRMDMVVFRRDILGAVVMVIYLEGDTPLASVGDLARTLDARMAEVLP